MTADPANKLLESLIRTGLVVGYWCGIGVTLVVPYLVFQLFCGVVLTILTGILLARDMRRAREATPTTEGNDV